MKYIKRFESNSELDKDIEVVKDIFQDIIDDYDIDYLDSEIDVAYLTNGSYYKIYKNKIYENKKICDILLRFIFMGHSFNGIKLKGHNGFEEQKINPNIEKLKLHGYGVSIKAHGGQNNCYLGILINVPDNIL